MSLAFIFSVIPHVSVHINPCVPACLFASAWMLWSCSVLQVIFLSSAGSSALCSWTCFSDAGDAISHCRCRRLSVWLNVMSLSFTLTLSVSVFHSHSDTDSDSFKPRAGQPTSPSPLLLNLLPHRLICGLEAQGPDSLHCCRRCCFHYSMIQQHIQQHIDNTSTILHYHYHIHDFHSQDSQHYIMTFEIHSAFHHTAPPSPQCTVLTASHHTIA